MTNTLDLLPCIYLHVKYTPTTNTYTYLNVNTYYADLFNLDSSIFNDKDVGYLDSLALSSYSDLSVLIYLTNLSNKLNYQYTINLGVKQNNITKTVNDTVTLILFGKRIETNDQYTEYVVIGFKDNYLTNTTLEPTNDRILNNLPIYVYWKDYNGKYLGSNNSLAPYLVVDEPVFTSLTITEPNTISYAKYCDNLILSTKSPLINIIETHLIAPEGKRLHVKANKIPISIKGFIIAILYTYEDVTEYVEQLNLLNETKELLQLKEQQYQELLGKVNNNSNIDTNVHNLFNNLIDKNNNSEKELLQLELLLNKIEEQVKQLYEKVYTSDNSIVSELAKLKQNQEEDLRNFTNNRLNIDDINSKLSSITNSISFILFFKNLTSKQLLLFFLVFSVLFTFVGNKINSAFIKQIIETVDKVI